MRFAFPLATIVGAQLCAAALLSMPAPALAQAEPEIVEVSVPASLSDTERMLVPVTIAGAGPYAFIVDTAAERSVISRELAAELQLQPAGRVGLLSMTDRREVGTVHVPDLSFLPSQTRNVQAFSLRGEHIGASGVLGIDALRGQRVVLDFEARTLSVGPAPRRTERFGPNDIVVRAQRKYGQLVLVDVTIDGAPVDVIVDSGTQVSVGNEALRRLLGIRGDTQQIALLSITGETLLADYTRADRLVIGNAVLSGMPVAFANARFFTRMKLTRQPALLLGMDALQMFSRVTVDFPNRRATFVLREGVQRERSPAM